LISLLDAIIGQDEVMTARSATRLAWFLGALTLALFVVYVALAVSRPARLPPGLEPFEPGQLLGSVSYLVFAEMGVLIAARRSDNRIGWLFIAIGSLFLFQLFAAEYALYGLYTDPGSLPAGAVMAWASTWPWLIAIGTLALVILLFPNGHLATRRWRPLSWIVVADAAFSSLGVALLLWPDRGLALLGGWEEAGVSPAALRVLVIGFPLLLVTILAAAVSLLLRFRRAPGDERQQLKWVAYGAGVLAASGFYGAVVGFRGDNSFAFVIDAVGTLALPVTTGVAVMRYRLYDIDVIINRTLVFGALTAILGLSYFAFVAGISSVAGESSVTVAGATLVVAALFRPLRQRIQSLIDRRFYRSKYDAEQTIADFSAKLRGEVDLDSLTSEMTAVIHATVQPTHVSLWIRP
jgi:hypothetical protein